MSVDSIGTVERGKLPELYVFKQILLNGGNAGLPLADTQGLDAIVRNKDGTLLEVQVKSSGADWSAGWFDVYDAARQPVDSFVIVGLDTTRDPYEAWIFPAEKFLEYATVSKTKDGSSLYRLGLESRSRKHENRVRRGLLERDLAYSVWMGVDD